jgi:hypothetical protein
MHTLRQAAVLTWGKIRRFCLIAFRKKKVQEKLHYRRGACHRCGACCKILFQCPAYDDSDGNPKCLIYNDRPGVCGLFPLDEKDLRDRNTVMPELPCGFYFVDKPNGAATGGPIREAMPLRWGPPRKNGDGRPNVVRGTFAILWSIFHKPNGNGKH